MLETDPTVQPLRQWAADFAAARARSVNRPVLVPHFDPAEAGVDAKVLVLLEAPGPMTNAGNARPGSGFISIDNDDVTAENCWKLRDQIGLDRGVLHWNIVPWYLGAASRKPNAAELRAGAAALIDLLQLLPQLSVVVACGLYAQDGWRRHVAPSVQHLEVLNTWHPSPLSLKQPGKRDGLRTAFAEAARQR